MREATRRRIERAFPAHVCRHIAQLMYLDARQPMEARPFLARSVARFDRLVALELRGLGTGEADQVRRQLADLLHDTFRAPARADGVNLPEILVGFVAWLNAIDFVPSEDFAAAYDELAGQIMRKRSNRERFDQDNVDKAAAFVAATLGDALTRRGYFVGRGLG